MTSEKDDAGDEGYDVPGYTCGECEADVKLRADRTGGLSTVGVGCDCTVENGRPFVSLRSSGLHLPERWSLDD